MIVGSLEDAEDLMGDVNIEDKTKNLPKAARAIEFESTRGGNKLAKKSREHIEAEKNLREQNGDDLMMPKESWPNKKEGIEPEESCKRWPGSRTNKMSVKHWIVNKKERLRVTDKNGKRNWKDTRGKSYQDEEMRMKARRELEMWEESSRKERERNGGSPEPKLTMSVIMQSRASFLYEKAVGGEGISAEVLKTVRWRALQKIKKDIWNEVHWSKNKEDIGTWLEKDRRSDSTEKGHRQTERVDERNLCAEHAGQVVLRLPHYFIANCRRSVEKKRQELG